MDSGHSSFWTPEFVNRRGKNYEILINPFSQRNMDMLKIAFKQDDNRQALFQISQMTEITSNMFNHELLLVPTVNSLMATDGL